MSDSGVKVFFTPIKAVASGVTAISILLASIYGFAGYFFVTVDSYAPIAATSQANAKQITILSDLLQNTVKLNEFKEYTYEKDIADALERIKQFDRLSRSRQLTLYETSQVEYLTEAVTRWQTALEELSHE